MPREAAAAFEARTITWMIFGPLRAHYAIATGHIATKAKASEYALTWLPTRWDGLIHDALAIERGVRQRLLRRTASSGIGEPTSDAHRRDRP